VLDCTVAGGFLKFGSTFQRCFICLLFLSLSISKSLHFSELPSAFESSAPGLRFPLLPARNDFKLADRAPVFAH